MNNDLIQQLEAQGFTHAQSDTWTAVYDQKKQHLDPQKHVQNEASNDGFSGDIRGGRFRKISPGNNTQWFVKQYHRGGILADQGDTSYPTPDRFLAELTAAVRADKKEIPVPTPVGVFWKQVNSTFQGYYVSEWIDGRRATQYLRDENGSDLMFQMGQILARLHDHEIDHQDYKPDNILIDEQGDVNIIDFDPVEFGTVPLIKREQRQHRFFRFLSKYGFDPYDKPAFLKGYRSSTETYSRPIHHALRLPNWIQNSASDLLHNLSNNSLKPVDLEKVILRVPNWLGDCVMTLPFLQSLVQHLELDHVDVVCRPSVQTIFQASPFVHRVFPLDETKSTTFPEEVRVQRYSLALILPKSFRTALQAWRSGIPRRLGYSTGFRSMLLTDRIPLEGKDRTMHHARLYYDLLPDLLQQPAELPSPELSLDDKWVNCTPDEWYSGNYITVHPGSAYGPAKRWPPEQFQQMLQEFLSVNDIHITFIGVSSEREIANNVKQNLPDDRITDLVGQTSLKECMVILRNSRATVANDSGIMHLTAALNTPVLALFGSSSPELTSPLGTSHQIIYKNVECSPCFEQKCPRRTEQYKCLTQIDPTDVYQRLEALLDKHA